MHRLAVLALLGGCSIISSRSVASYGPEKCTTSVGPAATDTILVVAAAAFATYAAVEMEDVDHIAIPMAIGTGAIFTISALVGYTRATRCKRAKIKNGIAY